MKNIKKLWQESYNGTDAGLIVIRESVLKEIAGEKNSDYSKKAVELIGDVKLTQTEMSNQLNNAATLAAEMRATRLAEEREMQEREDAERRKELESRTSRR